MRLLIARMVNFVKTTSVLIVSKTVMGTKWTLRLPAGESASLYVMEQVNL